MSTSIQEKFPEWQLKLKLLADSAWKDAEINSVKVDHWLQNFRGDTTKIDIEQIHALHLLTQFIYFGKREVDECLRVLFQEKFVYPLVQQQKTTSNDPAQIQKAIEVQVRQHTRFVGVGNPAESGPSFLYNFRKANNLPTEIFSSSCEVFSISPASTVLLYPSTLTHLVYLDDFCGTGDQVQRRIGWLVATIKMAHPHVKVSYFLLFATRQGLTNIQNTGLFDEVEAVIVFDADYKAFAADSHYYKENVDQIDKTTACAVMEHYGTALGHGQHALGFDQCQLLIGFYHNTPDNSLPVFWDCSDALPWIPIFPRAKKY